MSKYKYRIGQTVRIASYENLTPWGKPDEKVGFTFTISGIKESYPSKTIIYMDSKGRFVAAEANLIPVEFISKIRTTK